LKIPPGQRVIHVARRRLSGGAIVGHSERYLAEVLCPELLDHDLSTESVHELLVTLSTLPLLRSEFEIEAHSLTAGEAELLAAEAGVPAIMVARMTYTAPNRPAVWYRGLFREHYAIDIVLDDSGA
jgi:DNA-binding GntR family transcriptional regulator